MNIFFNFIFYIKKPALMVVFSKSESNIINLLPIAMHRLILNENISSRIKSSFSSLKNKVFLIEIVNNILSLKKISFLLKRSSIPILIINDKNLDWELIRNISSKGFIIVNTEIARMLKKEGIEETLINEVGFNDRSELWASDLNIGDETNFKINYRGDSVPFWIERKLNNDEIIEILLVVRAGMILGMNLVQISKNLKIHPKLSKS